MEQIPRFFKPPAQSFFLFGPRGTGTSTLLRELFPDAVWVDLLEPDVFRSHSARPELLRETVRARPADAVVVVDEVQRVPGLLTVVHSLAEGRE